MKKILFCFGCLLLCFNILIVNASEAPGHPEFQEIIIPRNSKAKLISDMDQKTIDNALNQLKRKVWGWSVNIIVKNQTVEYVGDTVFAKRNNTSQTLKYTYYVENESSFTGSVAVSSSLAMEAGGKIEGVSLSLDRTIRSEIGAKIYKAKTESTEILITIPPKRKLTVSIRGEARLNNGVSKFYIFGLSFKKGTWEYIDVVNEYYDYYEEVVY
ncbi:MAG: hypothetical protein IJX78_02235 [Bacilli bacterium]|nr:hypothetical protein [Bacilli bacterium]